MEERFIKAGELLENASFLEELKKASNHEDVQKLFARNGVALSIDDIEAMCVESVKLHGSEELDEDSLENVAGGILLTASAIACFALGTGSIAFYASYGYHSLIGRKK